jgi:pyruvate/2-oxoglutarate dehydrogenase complex dihydrolipoamide dehydrogenase (E3) component
MEQPEKFDTDYLIIGSGPGGDAAENRLGQLGAFDIAWSEPF